MQEFFFLKSQTRGYVYITSILLNLRITFGTTDPTFFKSRQKCEDVAKALSYHVPDIEVQTTDGMEDWYVKLLERHAI